MVSVEAVVVAGCFFFSHSVSVPVGVEVIFRGLVIDAMVFIAFVSIWKMRGLKEGKDVGDFC